MAKTFINYLKQRQVVCVICLRVYNKQVFRIQKSNYFYCSKLLGYAESENKKINFWQISPEAIHSGESHILINHKYQDMSGFSNCVKNLQRTLHYKCSKFCACARRAKNKCDKKRSETFQIRQLKILRVTEKLGRILRIQRLLLFLLRPIFRKATDQF